MSFAQPPKEAQLLGSQSAVHGAKVVWLPAA